jgi:hypothetical protein
VELFTIAPNDAICVFAYGRLNELRAALAGRRIDVDTP